MKSTYRDGDVIMIKENSTLHFNIPWVSKTYPYAKVYRVNEIIKNHYNFIIEKYVDDQLGYEYYIGPVDCELYEFWDVMRFVDYYEHIVPFNHISDNIKDHFYTNQELRKMKLKNLS